MASLLHFLKQSTSEVPDNIAVVQKHRSVNYVELYGDICSVASYLRDHGLSRGDRVAILYENSPEYIAIYYGILAAGGVVVGLNSAAKSRDLVNWLRHSGSTWLFTGAKHPELNSVIKDVSDSIRYVLLGDLPGNMLLQNPVSWGDVVEYEKSELDLSVIEENELAAIIYTSGTTGNPKGVMLSHRNLAHNTSSIIEYLKLDKNDMVMNVLPFYYSYGNSVLHTHMAVGATVVLENSLLYPHKILEVMENKRITGFSGVSSTFSLLLSRTKLKDYNLASLRYITQAGGAMAPSSIRKVLDQLPHVKFFVMYGQTEATARLSYLPPDQLGKKAGSAGIGIPGVELVIRNKEGKKMAPGETGQICAKGENIMLGYWRDPDATAEVIKDGWLLTGDLASCDEDGFIYINGRASEMIKSGANRISPREIEEVISEFNGVEEVAVVGIPDEILGQVIKAVVVAAPGVVLEKKKIQSYCRQNLAMYKVPKLIDFVAKLPKTASGKVKRFLLAETAKAS